MRLILLFLFLLTLSAQAITPWDASAIADAVEKGSWESSEGLYRELQSTDLPPDQKLQCDYNLGLSLYHQSKFQESLPFFMNAAKTEDDRELKAKALYNQGNAHFKLEQMDEAKKAYQDALLTNPDDDDARYNIEQILNKEKQDEQNKQDNQDKSDQQNENPEKQEGDQDQDKSEGDQKKDEGDQQKDKGEQNPDKSEQNKDQNQDQNQQEQQKNGGQDQEQQKQPSEMTEEERKKAQEEAERARLLDYFRQQEKDGRPATRVKAQAPPVRGKTW